MSWPKTDRARGGVRGLYENTLMLSRIKKLSIPPAAGIVVVVLRLFVFRLVVVVPVRHISDSRHRAARARE